MNTFQFETWRAIGQLGRGRISQAFAQILVLSIFYTNFLMLEMFRQDQDKLGHDLTILFYLY